MIIRNIVKKSKKTNLFRKLKKNLKKIYLPCITVLLLAASSAVMLFTPISNFLSEVFYDSILRQHNSDAKILSDFNITNLVLNISYPTIPMINFTEQTRTIGLKTLGYNSQDEFGNIDYDVFAEENNDSAYKMPITSDEPVMSIYEYYESMSGAKIIEAIIDNGDGEIPPGTYKITPVNSSGQKDSVPQLLMNNQTSFNNLDLNDFIKLEYPIKDSNISSSDPVVLILCTHATESYCETGTFFYSPPFTAERTSDINKNIVLIATELKNTLEKRGIPVVQSLKLHDEVSYQNSYTRSLETMNAYVQQYSSIKYVIDVHRDSMITQTGEKYKPTININGKNAAQLMMVIGTSDGGGHHPNWTENLTFATYMQQRLNDKYPMLARPINLRNARFNQHVTRGSIILEVGSCGSSFDEALYSARLFGECLADLIIEHGE